MNEATTPHINEFKTLRRSGKQLDMLLRRTPGYLKITCRGQRRGTTEGVPQEIEGTGYNTVRNGWECDFLASTLARGTQVEHDGKTWVVVWNGSRRGNAHAFDTNQVILAPMGSVMMN